MKWLRKLLKPKTSQPNPPTLHGSVDSVITSDIKGWLICENLPSDILLLSNNTPIAHTVGDLFRPDLHDIFPTSGFFGFEFHLNFQLVQSPSGAPLRLVDARYGRPVPGSEDMLAGWHAPDTVPEIDISALNYSQSVSNHAHQEFSDGVGAIEKIAPGWIQAWIRFRKNAVLAPTQKIQIVISDGDHLIRKQTLISVVTGHVRSFEIFLNDSDIDCMNRLSVAVHIDGKHAFDLRHPAALQPLSSAGAVIRRTNRLLVWLPKQHPAHIISVDLENGQRLSEKLEPQPSGVVNIAQLTIPFRGVDKENIVITATPEGSDGEIITTSIKHADRFRVHIDQLFMQGNILTGTGWALDQATPHQSLSLECWLADRLVATFSANQYREDLKSIGVGTGFHGFGFKIELADDYPKHENIKFYCREITDIVIHQAPIERRQDEPDFNNRLIVQSLRDIDGLKTEISALAWRDDGYLCGICTVTHSDLPPACKITLKDRAVKLIAPSDYTHLPALPKKTLNSLGLEHSAQVFTDPNSDGKQWYFETDLRFIALQDRQHIACTAIVGETLQSAAHRIPAPFHVASRPLAAHPMQLTGNKPSRFISYIILTLNGEALLNSLLQSMQLHLAAESCEILIVDHGSHDDTANVIAAYSRDLNIRYFPRGENFSFSASNNWAAEKARGEILVFLNNDIILTQDITATIDKAFENKDIAVCGIKLHDLDITIADPAAGATQHLGVFFTPPTTDNHVSPYEMRWSPPCELIDSSPVEAPAVTGALMAMRKTDFVRLGGFDEKYFYGYEDIDLCLRQSLYGGGKIISLNNLAAIHQHGITRARPSFTASMRARANKAKMEQKFAADLRRKMREDLLARPGFWSGKYPQIAFAVSEASETTDKGDFYTAMEFGDALQKILPCCISYLNPDEWYDLSEIDIVIAMRQDFDPKLIKSGPSHQLCIAWARNWFDAWADAPQAFHYDLYWASSQDGRAYLQNKLSLPVSLVPIATNINRFSTGARVDSMAYDYAFTGNYFNTHRDIIDCLEPDLLPHKGAVFGSGWEAVAHFQSIAKGLLPYEQLPDLYASTKIIIDDANHATLRWGSVNSRVFDALAAGALVVTNGVIGANQIFEGLLPTYTSQSELQSLLDKYLNDEKARRSLVEQLQRLIREKHNYDIRAKSSLADLSTRIQTAKRIAIKMPSYTGINDDLPWLYHLTRRMQQILSAAGHLVRVDPAETDNTHLHAGDDIIIHLGPMPSFEANNYQKIILWQCVKPWGIAPDAYAQYDTIFTISERHQAQLHKRFGVNAAFLPPMKTNHPTNTNTSARQNAARKIAICGYADGEFVPALSSLEGLEIRLFGPNWHSYSPPSMIGGEHISPQELLKLREQNWHIVVLQPKAEIELTWPSLIAVYGEGLFESDLIQISSPDDLSATLDNHPVNRGTICSDEELWHRTLLEKLC